MNRQFNTKEEFAVELDEKDELKDYRKYFYIPDATIYLNGNSLGLMCGYSEMNIKRIIEEWKRLGVNGWWKASTPWINYAEKIGAMAAKLVGASPTEVIATGTTTINIHSLISTFYKPTTNKRKILADSLNFPTDIYALYGQLKFRGFDPTKYLVLVQSNNSDLLDEKIIIENMTDDILVALLPSVLYRSGQLLDLAKLTQEAHKRNIIIGFDCSHSVGVIPHYFDEWDVDFAVWCSYKYMNGGPGSTAFLYINKKHFTKEPVLIGWFGYKKDKQFDMLLDFEHEKSASGWQISSPSIISLASVEGALKLLLEIGINNIRNKSIKMTSYLIYLVDELLNKYNINIITPREENKRGGHIALQHPEAQKICDLLEKNNIITDFRPPNILRIAPSPLYNTYHEIWKIIYKIYELLNQ